MQIGGRNAGVARAGAILFLYSVNVACVSFSSFQPADTLKPGRAYFFGAAGNQKIAQPKTEEGDEGQIISSDLNEVTLPFIEYGFRFGLDHDFDIGVRTALFGAYTLDGKYRLVQAPRYSLATGLGVGTSVVNVADIADDDDGDNDMRIYEVSVPLYYSYHLTESFLVYTVPRIMFRRVRLAGITSTGNMAGASFGFIYGTAGGFSCEYSYFSGSKEAGAVKVSQFMVGFIFGLDNLDRYQDRRRRHRRRPPS